MKQKKSGFLAGLCIAFIAFLSLNSCKEDSILGANVIPAGDTVSTGTTDTITILSKTFFDDSLITSESVPGIPIFHALGTVTSDPYFGKTHAGIYMQVVPPTLGFNFSKAPDSAFLILPYSGFTWGDTSANTTQSFNLYEVTDSMSKDVKYYNSSYRNADKSKLLGSASVNFQSLRDSMSFAGAKRPAHLRIRLDQDFVEKIKNEAANNTETFNSYAAFLGFLKGFYVVPADTNSGNALFYFRLDGSTDYTRGNVLFFYTDKGSNNQDTVKTTSFFFNSTYASHFNRIIKDFNGTATGALLASPNASDSVMIIQNEPGAVADLKFPFIRNLPKQPILKAELIITEFSFTGDMKDKYFPPPRIYPIGINANGQTYNVLDRYPLESTGPLVFMDGSRKSVTIGALTVNQYVLNLPREVQRAIVEQRDTLHLRITGAGTFPGAYRLIGTGGNNSNAATRVKLKIVYSKL